MKIDSSTIRMDSDRVYTSSTQVTQTTTMTQEGTGITRQFSTDFGATYATYSEMSLQAKDSQYDSYQSGRLPDNQATPSDLYSNWGNNRIQIPSAKTRLEQLREEFVQRIEEFMERIKEQLLGIHRSDTGSLVELATGTQPGTLWKRQDYQSVTMTETEVTTFQSNGTVVTADGRRIDFDISMEMSRSFMETSESLSESTEYILTDPLVIQLENAPETIQPQKWHFDLDCDGNKEELSSLSQGNGFLALDRNNNGKIDDGNELFGTKSGNGFKDLAAYDEDGNGWIDENDSIYSSLKIWTKNADGTDRLMDLQQADVGAIYLGAVNTRFSHNQIDTNDTMAMVRQTGFYLHESTGAAGTIQQIDFATKVEKNEVA